MHSPGSNFVSYLDKSKCTTFPLKPFRLDTHIAGKDQTTCLLRKPIKKQTTTVITLSNLKMNSQVYKTPFVEHEMLVLPVAAKIRETSVTNPLS